MDSVILPSTSRPLYAQTCLSNPLCCSLLLSNIWYIRVELYPICYHWILIKHWLLLWLFDLVYIRIIHAAKFILIKTLVRWTYFLKHSLRRDKTCLRPLVPNSWIHSNELFVRATLRDSMQAYFVLRFRSGLLRYWM